MTPAIAGRELARNAAIGGLALATGLRLQEFSYLLAYEIPALPPAPTGVPIPFPVPAGVTKGRKFRTTWIAYEALAGGAPVPGPGPGRGRGRLGVAAAAAAGASRCWSPTRMPAGGRINGVRRPWDSLTPGERRRLVAPGGGSCLLAVRGGGGPFTAWPTVFERTSRPDPRHGSSRGSRTSTRTGSATLSPLSSRVAITLGTPCGLGVSRCAERCCVPTVSARDLDLFLFPGLAVLGS